MEITSRAGLSTETIDGGNQNSVRNGGSSSVGGMGNASSTSNDGDSVERGGLNSIAALQRIGALGRLGVGRIGLKLGRWVWVRLGPRVQLRLRLRRYR